MWCTHNKQSSTITNDTVVPKKNNKNRFVFFLRYMPQQKIERLSKSDHVANFYALPCRCQLADVCILCTISLMRCISEIVKAKYAFARWLHARHTVVLHRVLQKKYHSYFVTIWISKYFNKRLLIS